MSYREFRGSCTLLRAETQVLSIAFKLLRELGFDRGLARRIRTIVRLLDVFCFFDGKLDVGVKFLSRACRYAIG